MHDRPLRRPLSTPVWRAHVALAAAIILQAGCMTKPTSGAAAKPGVSRAPFGVLANGALALGSWITLALGKPFTLEYARAHTDPSKWNEPVFIRTNVQLTAVWASAFTVNAVIAWAQMEHVLAEWICHSVSYAMLIAAAAFTSWYPNHVRAKAQRSETR